MLATRGVKPEEKDDYLEPKLRNLLPKADLMKDIGKAVKRIMQAIENDEKICIFGDYDVDGSTSTAMWILFFEKLGIKANYYIPDRLKEGYGPNCNAIEKIAKNGVKLLISVDCGTTAFEPFEKAKLSGMDVVIIDHHQSGETLPNCVACVNPNRSDEISIGHEMKSLCACGVSFFVIMAINAELKKQNKNIDLMHFTPLVGFATVCDVMNLTSLNRAFIKTGISVLQKDKSFNLCELLQINNEAKFKHQPTNGLQNGQINITAYSFGFLLGPMVNAGGRIGNSSLGVELMIEKDKNNARIMAEKLFQLNEERKEMETNALYELVDKKEEIKKQIQENGYIMLYSKDWHEGIIGLMASRIKEKYFYPVFIGAQTDEGIVKFSSRSVDGVDVGQIILEAKDANLLIAGGGHKLAGGMSCEVEKIAELKEFLKKKVKKVADINFATRTIRYDVALSLGGLTMELLEKISKFEPFGIGNEKPIFLIRDVFVKHADVIKDKHVSLSIMDEENFERAICFNCIDNEIGKFLLSSKGKTITLIVSADIAEWKGQNRKNIRIENVVI